MSSKTEPSLSDRKREEHLSKDGKWRSFPKVPHLLQYVSNANYYGRIKIDGKTIRESLKTDVWTTAKLRLTDFLKRQHENRDQLSTPTFAQAVELFKRQLASDTTIKPQSKKYRLWCLGKLKNTWPGLWDLHLDEVSPTECQEWAANLNSQITCHYYNNTIGTLNQVIQVGIKSHKENGGGALENPAAELKKTKIKQKELRLPEPSQLKGLIDNLCKRSGGWGPRIGDLVEFLAYSGLRVKSEAMWVRWEDIDWRRREIIVRGDPTTGTKNGEIRRVPLIGAMEKLLKRLRGESDNGKILQVNKCNEALARACREFGISRLTHHDLRHLFATRYIESGVDIPTVSRWLGGFIRN